MPEKPTYEELMARVEELEKSESERRFIEKEHLMLFEVLQLINETDNMEDLLGSILHRLKEGSGCEAVAIRLKDGQDYPYYVTSGFPDRFVEMERHLCSYNENGEVKCDSKGDPLLECMCGNIISGRFDPSKTFFTEDGSFWSNCTTKLLATTSDADRQARTRNRCNSEGYESVALIPLRSAGETFGLIQLNDHQTGRFSSELIGMYRRVADYIAGFLAKRKARDNLRKSEEHIRRQLEEKEVLLKEIHHRVKNNMQVVTSLIDLQANEINDEGMRNIFRDVVNRIHSMAMVHEKLYQSEDLSRIDFSDYVQSLLRSLWHAHAGETSRIQLNLDLKPVFLSINAAVPCGLVLNELFSNSLKHAFKGTGGGIVDVSLDNTANGEVQLSIGDNGSGFPPELDWKNTKTLGLRIVQMLTIQLHAVVDMTSSCGTRYMIKFPA